MVKRARLATFPAVTAISLEPEMDEPLYKQLYDGLRRAILTGEMEANTRLPSSRILADELAVSRNTVVNAFDQLIAEGYLESRVGDGTYVAHTLPDELLHVTTEAKTAPRHDQHISRRGLSRRGAMLSQTAVCSPRRLTAHEYPIPFRAGLPAYDAFPFDVWARLEARLWRDPLQELVTYGNPAGYEPLREAIAAYLNTARGVHCKPDQIIIVSGSQQALTLSGMVLLDPGDVAWIEEPGYLGARAALIGASARLVPVPVDEEGIVVSEGIAREPTARLAYVSPSHQHPLGVTMSLSRRLALLEWAAGANAWILEDDYDSEYRYTSRPLAALQGLDRAGCVIYIGTFSKVMFPGLRLGYMVVPPDLVEAFVSARAIMDRHSPLPEQAVLAEFIGEGHFANHIRRMRALYATRQAALIQSIREYAPIIEANPADAGMHLIGWLPLGMDDKIAAEAAATYEIDVAPLSIYRLQAGGRGGLLLGYAALDEATIRDGVQRLAEALRTVR